MGHSTAGGQPRQLGDGMRPPTTGHVRKSFGHFDGAVSAATFRGLPEGVAHPKQLLEPLRRCGSRLPIPREALATLELLFDYTKLSDWEPGGTPLVFPGNAELAGCLGVTERTVRNHLSALEGAGLISIFRGPGNRRMPVWNGAGEMIAAYGINLAPVAEQSEAFRLVGKEQAERRRTLKVILRQVGEALQDVRTAVDAVEVVLSDASVDPLIHPVFLSLREILARSEEKCRLARRIWERDAAASVQEQADYMSLLLEIRDQLIDFAGQANTDAMSLLQNLSSIDPFMTKISGDPEIEFRDDSTKTSLNKSNLFHKEVVTRVDYGAEHRHQAVLPGFEPVTAPERPGPLLVKPHHLLSLCPEFRTVLTEQLLQETPETASTASYHDAARLIALNMGVSDWCWRTGCNLHGRGQALLAVAVALLKPRDSFTKNRQSFLAGMLLRPQGQLNALASFHALRKRRQEE